MSSTMDIAAAKALLQRKEGASSVYDHVTDLLLKVLTENPSNALENFERISASVKAGAFPPTVVGAKVGGQAATETYTEATVELLKQRTALYKAAATEDGSAGEATQDFVHDATYLEWAGLNFGRTEAFRLHASLKHLAVKYPAKKLRFWGKLLGKKNDYYVAEGILDPEGDEEDAKDQLGNTIQKTGEGPNKYTYFVCHGIGEAWVKLPNVTPHQVIVARQLRRFLSGDLTAAVTGHPPFPGTEANLVRAIIAIISSATVLAPTGAYTPVDGDEEGDIQENEEEWEAPDLASVDAWTHLHLDLNALGRTKANPPQVNDDGEEVPDPDAPEPSAPLRSAADDPAVQEDEEEGGGAWDVRSLPVSASAEGETPLVVVLKSLRWPGAFTVGFAKKRFANIYIGYGYPVALEPYMPQLPSAAPAEYDFTAEGQVVREAEDVIADPDAGKAAEGEGEEQEE